MKKRVFVIHGRDTEARDELIKLINALGLEARVFSDVASEIGSTPQIAAVVHRGISESDAVIALFTPDEQATLHLPDGDQKTDRQETRWQARPNVIFEAGLARGIAQDKTILATIGSDVRSLFSDLSGFHYIELEDEKAKDQLRRRLSIILKEEIKPRRKKWKDSSISGDFKAVIRRRWPYYDELQELESQLREVEISNPPVSLFEVVREVAVKNRNKNWSRQTSKHFMEAVRQFFGGKRGTEDAYWWLIVHGFLRFEKINGKWWSGEPSWRSSVDYSELAERGIRLLTKLQRLSS